MEKKSDPIDSLFSNFEQYNKINVKLLKLKSIDKTADVISTLVSRTFLVIAFTILLITLTISASLWIGEWLGKYYYGFLLVSLIYGILGAALILAHPRIKRNVANSVVKGFLN